MKRIFAGLAVAAMSVSMAIAADDPMASRYGNTVVITGPDGKEVGRIYYDADKKVSRKMADGSEVKGTWALEGGKLCFSQTMPAPKPEEAKQCSDFPGAKNVGDSWEVATPQGKLKATLTKGRP
ncbi:MAG: hypothetical protein ACK6DM_03065 [Alphaproteobacteria bacterium]|jgi:hypothetical protein